MKALISLACLLTLASPLVAQQPKPVLDASLKAWASSKIKTLEAEGASFDEVLAQIKDEWRKQHPDLSLPLAIVEYRREPSEYPKITMSLRDVSFAEALDYLGDASRLRLAGDSNFPRIDLGGVGNYDDLKTAVYVIPPGVLQKLGLATGDPSEKVAATYSRFGVSLQPWMTIVLSGEKLILRAEKEQHQLVAGINGLLAKGCMITPPEKP